MLEQPWVTLDVKWSELLVPIILGFPTDEQTGYESSEDKHAKFVSRAATLNNSK